MFNTYDFAYAGVSASEFGLYVCDVGSKTHGDNTFGNQANIVESRIGGRVSPLHYGVKWNESPLSFSLIFASDEEMDRYQLQEVALWLTGYQQYQWLKIDQPDLSNVWFKCLVQKLTPITSGWAPVAFQADFICDCPYGYSDPFEFSYDIDGEASIVFCNLSTCREYLRPEMEIAIRDGCTEFYIKNETTDKTEFLLSGLPAGEMDVLIDNENCIIQELIQGYDLYDYCNFSFLDLAVGNNSLVIKGNGKLTLRGRYLYNVGA